MKIMKWTKKATFTLLAIIAVVAAVVVFATRTPATEASIPTLTVRHVDRNTGDVLAEYVVNPVEGRCSVADSSAMISNAPVAGAPNGGRVG